MLLLYLKQTKKTITLTSPHKCTNPKGSKFALQHQTGCLAIFFLTGLCEMTCSLLKYIPFFMLDQF